MSKHIGAAITHTGTNFTLSAEVSQHTLVYDGSSSAIFSAYNQHYFAGARHVNLSSQPGGLWQLAATYESPTVQIVNTVQLINNVTQKDILEHPRYGIFEGLLDDQVELIRWAIDHKDPEAEGFLEGSNMAIVIKLMRDGLRYREVDAPILRRTKTISNKIVETLSFANVGLIISPSRIVAEADIGAFLRFNLPIQTYGVDATYVYGWKKRFPQVEQSAGSLAILTQDFEYGMWSTYLHPTVGY